MSNVTHLMPWEVHEFNWGTAIKKRNGDWLCLFLYPDGQEINVENIKVELHENGIEFL